MGASWRFRGNWRAWALAATVVLPASFQSACHKGIDTERDAPPKATLGDDMYALLCDRLGASVLSEDLTGASYHDVCHFDRSGQYGNAVDVSVLPPVEGATQTEARRLSLAKMHRMAERRSLLIRAFNAAFPDVEVPDVSTESPDDQIRLHDALLRFSQDITELYEKNPYASETRPLMPDTTRALGRLFGTIEQSDEARAALERIAGRQGYRPYRIGLGAVRTLLGYPNMRPFVRSQLAVLGPDGTAAVELQNMLDTVKGELETAFPLIATLPPYQLVDPAAAQPNRPRTALEVGAALMLDQADEYAVASGSPPHLISLRDQRGFIVPAGNTPGVPGSVPAPFTDLNNDGYADVDGLGRFIDVAGAPLPLMTPFYIPGQQDVPPVDEFGIPMGSPYAYLDTSRTLVAAMARDTVGIVDPNKYAPEDAPQPWLVEHEALMYALSGLKLIAGPREPAQFDHVTETVVPAGEQCLGALDTPCDVATNDCSPGFSCQSLPGSSSGTACVRPCTAYDRFVGEASPLPDLAHGVGQVLAHPDSDVILLGLEELLTNHRPVVARVLKAALDAKAIADAHDQLALQGVEEKAELAYEVPIWDEMAQVVSAMAQHPGLLAGLKGALADPVVVQSHTQPAKVTGPPSQHMGETIAAFMKFRDKYTYDPQDINGAPYNVTDGYPSFANPHNLVDRTQPLNGDNRSMFERSAQLIYDGNRVKACNKQGAKVATGIGGLLWPLTGSGYDQCELFTFENIGAVFLNAQLPTNHPKRAELVIQDGVLESLLNFIGGFTSKDAFLESASGITGMTLHPTPPALSRLMFFGAESDQFGIMFDHDTVNDGGDVDDFVQNAVEPVAGIVCPPNPNGVPLCSTVDDVLRARDYATIFGWEKLGFFQYLRPQLQVFAEVSCPSAGNCDPTDYTGENYFLDLITTLWKHWAGPDAGPYCNLAAAKNDPRYCSGAGVNRYEPIIAEVLEGDLIPALHELAVTVSSIDITYQRGPKAGQTVNGLEIIELIAKIMFDQTYAASVGMTDRFGQAGTTWVDGTPQAQITPYNMFADALRGMDLAFDASADETAPDRKSRWKRARSLLVDQFLLVQGEGNAATFVNPATPRTMLTGVRVLREQVNANCPDRETTGQCNWARYELGDKLARTLSRPVFATMIDVVDKLNQDDQARRELGWFLTYAMQSGSGQDALLGMLTSLTDLMQMLRADGDLAPIFNAVATACTPRDGEEGPGAADRTIQVLGAMSSDDYDRYHVLDYVLPALVTPMDQGAGLTPLEVILDAIADVNRTDAEALGVPLDARDYGYVMQTLREFFTSETRGFEQLYYIVQNRPRE